MTNMQQLRKIRKSIKNTTTKKQFNYPDSQVKIIIFFINFIFVFKKIYTYL